MSDKSTVVVVDPQPLFRYGVAHALANTRRFNVVGQGATADDAVSLAAQHSPKLAFMGIEPGESGLRGRRAGGRGKPANLHDRPEQSR